MMGQIAGLIKEIRPLQVIIEEMVYTCEKTHISMIEKIKELQ